MTTMTTMEMTTHDTEQLRDQLQEMRQNGWICANANCIPCMKSVRPSPRRRDLNSILRETLRVSLKTVCADAGSLLLYDAEKRKLVFEFVVGKTELIGMEIDPETDLNGKASTVFRTGQPLITLDTMKEGYNRLSIRRPAIKRPVSSRFP